MIHRYTEDDLARFWWVGNRVVFESEHMQLLREIMEANQQQHSKYAVNQILIREGIEIPPTTR